MTHQIFHITDAHVRDQAGANRLSRLLSMIPDGAVVALTGDLVDQGGDHEYELLDRALEGESKRLRLMPVCGNHDAGGFGLVRNRRSVELWDDMLKAHAATFELFSGLQIWWYDGVKIIGLDTCARHEMVDEMRYLARGYISPRTAAALEVELADEDPTVLLFHHDPFAFNPTLAMTGAAQLIGSVSRRPHVKAALFGHMHVERRNPIGETSWFCGGDFKTRDELCSVEFNPFDEGGRQKMHRRRQMVTL